MRNLFDQYKHPENRLTHALLTALHEDRELLGHFITWAIGSQIGINANQLSLLEQALPGVEEPPEAETTDSALTRKGLPDGCIFNGYDNNSWSLLIESKIAAPLTIDQLNRHRKTAQDRGLQNPHILALVASWTNTFIEGTQVKRWTDLYLWLKQRKGSSWARRLTDYMEILEAKLFKEEYLQEGALTVFTGIPFGIDDHMYSYTEAKRLLRLAMNELQHRSDLVAKLGVNENEPRRKAITGKGSSAVWDFLKLSKAGVATNTEYPHLTLGIHREYLHAVIIVPNGIRTDFRRNLLCGGTNEFQGLFRSVLTNFNKSFVNVNGVFPSVEVVQRRYKTQRSEPLIDAKLEFDLRTAFEKNSTATFFPKIQPQWLEATYDALNNRASNLQLAVGSKFHYVQCEKTHTPEILDYIANAWLACEPLLKKMKAIN